MPKRDDLLLLDDIVLSIKRIEEYIDGLDKKGFLDDNKTVDAVIRNLEVIGEAAKHLSIEFKNDKQEVPWALIVGMRNRVVHDYLGIDKEIIWEICNVNLKEMKKMLVIKG